jgi:hypothetical protein
MSDKPKMYAWTPENVKPENYVTAMNLMLARIDELVAIKERLERELRGMNKWRAPLWTRSMDAPAPPTSAARI